MKTLVTGAAGFIGYHLVNRLLADGYEVFGIDSLNDYYDVRLKYARLAELGIETKLFSYGSIYTSDRNSSFRFQPLQLEDRTGLEQLFSEEHFDLIINLAAQAGVRYSLENPFAYIDSNINGFVNLLECCHRHPVRHLLYASSSSVYGGNVKVPFSEQDDVNTPVSLYAATKRSGELIAQFYAHCYGIPLTGLRFFTVYGPWGRPDMAPMLFSRAILSGEAIKVYNHGNMERDFTYIDDIIESVIRLTDQIPTGDTPAEIYNIGNGHPVPLMTFIHTLETALGSTAELDLQPMQPGDMDRTWADTTKLQQKIHFCPNTSLGNGIKNFIKWYLSDRNPLDK